MRRLAGVVGAALAVSCLLFSLRVSAATIPGQRIVTVGPSESDFSTIQAAIDSITDSSAAKLYTVLIDPGTYEVGNATDNYAIKMNGTSGTVDYISLVGRDRDTVIITRLLTLNQFSPVIEASVHARIANLTITSPVSRLVHWDNEPNATLIAQDLYLPQGGGGAGISTGLHAGGRLTVMNCEFGSANFATHNASGTADAMLNLTGNVFEGADNTKIIVDMSTGTNTITVRMSGNVAKYNSGQSASAVAILRTVEHPALQIFTDWSSGLVFRPGLAGLGFWNTIRFPQSTVYPQTTASAEGDVVTLGANTMARTSVEGDLWPAVVIEGGGTIGTSPRLATGPYAEVNMDSAAVAIGDTIITSTTPGLATANNQQSDYRRILGLAATAKAGGAPGRVVVRLTNGNK